MICIFAYLFRRLFLYLSNSSSGFIFLSSPCFLKRGSGPRMVILNSLTSGSKFLNGLIHCLNDRFRSSLFVPFMFWFGWPRIPSHHPTSQANWLGSEGSFQVFPRGRFPGPSPGERRPALFPVGLMPSDEDQSVG